MENYETKKRYKMYKAGKNWVVAPLVFLGLAMGVSFHNPKVMADTNVQTQTDSNNDNQTNKQEVTLQATQNTESKTVVNQENSSQQASVENNQSVETKANEVADTTQQTSANQEVKQSTPVTVQAQSAPVQQATPANNNVTTQVAENKVATAPATPATTSEQNQNTQVVNNSEQASSTSSTTQKSEEPKVETPVNTADNASQKKVNDNWYLVDNNTGKNLTGFQEIKDQNKVVYYAPSNAQMQYGWQNINSNRYYFDTFNGAMTTGQRNIDGSWYLFDNQGVMQTGFQRIASQNKTVYYSEDKAKLGQMQYGQKNIKGNWYNFDTYNGAMKTGFVTIPSQNKTVYYSEDKAKLGQMQYGKTEVKGKTYYFDTYNGAMKKGLTNINGNNYYFDNSGVMVTGQKNISGNWYMFNDQGIMQTGFVHIPSQNKIVYYSEDKNKLGQMQYGKNEINGKTYYFDTFDGAMVIGQKNIDNHWYLFDNKGAMQVGFRDLDGGKRTVYYSEAKSSYGQMLYGNQVINGKNYYFDTTTGAMRKGTLVFDKTNHTLSYVTNEGLVAKNTKYKINNVEYVFNVAGILEHLQGEANIAGNWYLFDNNNHVLIGFQTLKDGRKVYYSPNNAQMQYGQQNIDGHWYLFDKVNGSMQTGFKDLTPYGQNKTVYYASNGQMQYGKQNIAGHWYLFNNVDGAMYKGWLMSGNDWYYYNQQNGQLQTGSAVINDVGYNFDGNGKQILNYSIDYRYALPAGKGDDETAANNYIILHDVGVESGAATNARYFHDTVDTNESYVTFVVGDGGKVYQVGRPGQVSWGAGRVANHNAPVQIELGRTYNSGQFWQDYVTYVRVARDMAGKYGIPLTLDAGGAGTRGIKSHYWVTKNIWGDHVDPYGYLSRFGVTQAKLAHDLLYGV